MSDGKVFICLGDKKPDTAEVNKRISKLERELGRPVTDQEILQIMGELIEPDPTKRLYLSARPGRLPRLD